MIFSNNRLGKFIRNGRLDLNLTQEQLAEKLNQCHLVSSLESPRHLTCEVIISMIYGRFLTLSDKMIQLEYFRV